MDRKENTEVVHRILTAESMSTGRGSKEMPALTMYSIIPIA